jgi:transcriptional regulator with XRE-family HTH domain
MVERQATIRQRRLAAELRHLRERQGVSLDQASERLGWSKAKLSRIETARSGVKVGDLARLLELYEVPEARREGLVSLARNARQRGWWDAYADELPTDYSAYLELESEAISLRCYDAVVLHGLMQTEEYAREVIRSALMQFSPPAEVDKRVEVRMTRQDAAFTRRELPLRFWTVIDENCLRRSVGGPEVMRNQLHHLLEMAKLPNVMLQVLPHEAGAHPGSAGTFALLELPEQNVPDIVYVETMTSALYVEDPSQVHMYGMAFDQLRADALGPDESLAMLAKMAEDL